MYGRPVTQTERLNMRLPPDLKRRLDRLAVTRDFEVRSPLDNAALRFCRPACKASIEKNAIFSRRLQKFTLR